MLALRMKCPGECVKIKSGELYGKVLLGLAGGTIWGGVAWLAISLLIRG
jgi:hypothetical protein